MATVSYSSEFFTTVAGLLPTMFLALVLEEALQEKDEPAPSPTPAQSSDTPDSVTSPVHSSKLQGFMDAYARVSRTWALALIVVGEIAALSVVATNSPSSGAGQFLVAVLALATFFIITPVVDKVLDSHQSRSRRERLGHAAPWVLLVAVLIGVTIGAQ